MTALFVGMVRRNAIELYRYGFDSFLQFGGLFLLFVLIFYGARSIGGPAVTGGSALQSLVIGFVVFSLIILSFATLANWVTNQALQGTLEQLAVSPFGLLRVLTAEFLASQLSTTLIVVIFLLAAESVTGQRLHLHLLTLVPLAAALTIQVFGIGLALSGAALVFKRVTSLLNLLQFGFLALLGAPLARHPMLKALPVSLGYDLIRRSAISGAGLAHLRGADLLILGGGTVTYLLAGVAVFTWMERVARERSSIGVY